MYSSALALTPALDGGQRHAQVALPPHPPGKTRYPLLGGSQGQSDYLQDTRKDILVYPGLSRISATDSVRQCLDIIPAESLKRFTRYTGKSIKGLTQIEL